MIKTIFLVGTGGFIGSVLRLLLQTTAAKYITIAFPVGTFVVNVLGCFIIGLIYGLTNKTGLMTAEWRFFLATGLCGGFTTFSTFSYESITLFKQGSYTSGALYITGSVLIGLLATLGGIAIVNLLNKMP